MNLYWGVTWGSNMHETWKPVPGYEGLYEVSDFGNVRGVDRMATNAQGIELKRQRGKILCQGTDRIKRKVVDLYKHRSRKTAYVHFLVLSAFVGPRPDGMDCCHNDGNPSNNHIVNLRYDTRSGNFKDKLIHGTHNRGENSPVKKLTEAQVHDIRRRAESGDSHENIATDFPISRRHVTDIINRIYWFHI
jgi:hypothetical protein